jgi:hypothetical protein
MSPILETYLHSCLSGGALRSYCAPTTLPDDALFMSHRLRTSGGDTVHHRLCVCPVQQWPTDRKTLSHIKSFTNKITLITFYLSLTELSDFICREVRVCRPAHIIVSIIRFDCTWECAVHLTRKRIETKFWQDVLERTNSPTFLTLFNNCVKYEPWFVWFIWLNNGSNYGIHCCTRMGSTVTLLYYGLT